MSEKRENSLDMGAIPGRYLGNQRPDRHVESTGELEIERADVCSVIRQVARATCNAAGTVDENLPFLDVFHD